MTWRLIRLASLFLMIHCVSGSQDYSFLVSIQGYNFNDTYEHICAGAFIRNEFILTAARCVDRRRNITDFTIYTRPGTNDAKKYKVQKSRVFINPEWYEKPSYLKGDLALIHVPGLRRGKNFVPIELPSLSYYPNAYFDNCTVSGWIRRDLKPNEDVGKPNIVRINVIGMSECYNIYNLYAQTAHKICTRNDFDQDCPQDHATVLTCLDYNFKQVLTGMASFGPLFCGVLSMPAVFSNIAYNLQWIVESIYT